MFPTTQGLIDHAKAVVPRELTPCERKRFFLPVEGGVGDLSELASNAACECLFMAYKQRFGNVERCVRCWRLSGYSGPAAAQVLRRTPVIHS